MRNDNVTSDPPPPTPHPHKISYSILPLAQQTSSILKDETIALMSKLLLSETITTYF